LKNNLILRFISHFTIYILAVAALAAFPLYKKAPGYVIEGLIANVILFYVLSIISFWLVNRTAARTGGNVLNAYFTGMGIKMLIALIYFMVLLGDFKGKELQFAVTFFIAYLVCTVFEVNYLLRNLRRN
jgi:heme/copper-type cytochrome/quinol oxidase subunit 4